MSDPNRAPRSTLFSRLGQDLQDGLQEALHQVKSIFGPNEPMLEEAVQQLQRWAALDGVDAAALSALLRGPGQGAPPPDAGYFASIPLRLPELRLLTLQVERDPVDPRRYLLALTAQMAEGPVRRVTWGVPWDEVPRPLADLALRSGRAATWTLHPRQPADAGQAAPGAPPPAPTWPR